MKTITLPGSESSRDFALTVVPESHHPSLPAEYPATIESRNDLSLVEVETRITTALLLAAGTGSRLQPLTKAAPKCLTEVNGVSILERLVSNLRDQGFNRLVVVIGHLGDQIREFLALHASDLQVDYVYNPDFATTNNLYSLWLARKEIKEAFMLVESDLIFHPELLDKMVYPDKMAISSMLPWMNGTTVELDSNDCVSAFRSGAYTSVSDRQYKTVNIYSLSLNSWKKVEERLTQHVEAGELGEYYEVVFTEMIADGTLTLDGIFFDSDLWYEIDTGKDLIEAENLFSHSRNNFSEPVPDVADYPSDSCAMPI